MARSTERASPPGRPGWNVDMKSVRLNSGGWRAAVFVDEVPGCSAELGWELSNTVGAGSSPLVALSLGEGGALAARTSFFFPFLPFSAYAGAALRFDTRFDARNGGGSEVERAGVDVHDVPSAVTSTTSTAGGAVGGCTSAEARVTLVGAASAGSVVTVGVFSGP